jgi:serine/alanine adding enzyme
MRIVQQLDNTIWRSYVDQNPLGNIFHTPEMYQVFAHAKGYSPALWAATDEHGEPLSLMQPVQITLMKGPMRLLSSRAVAYGSVLCTPNAQGHEALARLLQRYKQAIGMSLLFTELRNLADLTEIQPTLDESGFVYEDHLNYLIDLQQPRDSIWQKVSSRTRSYIRGGLKRSDLSIREVDSPQMLKDSYELLRKTYANARIPLADYSLFQAIFDLLCPLKMARISSVYFGNIPIATSVDLLYKGVIYYWYGGMDRQYGSHHASELLRWHVIEWGINNGYRTFDFGGAGKPDEEYSVRDFKAKFGGELVSLGRSACVHSPYLLNLSKRGYELYRRFMFEPAHSTRGGRTH